MAKFKAKIKKGDEVIVIAGKDKGRRGKVLQVKQDRKDRVRVLVEGINMVKKAVRPNPNVGEQGGIKDQEAFLDISNVKLFNPMSGKGERVGFRCLEDGKKVRYYKSSNEAVEADQS